MTTTQSSSEIKLQPSHLDLSSTRAQLVLGLILIAISCAISYWKSCNVGFLLDDFYHVDYVSRAFQGHWHDFVQKFYGNWSDTYALTCYRPAISVSYFVDYLLWGVNAVGYHICNSLMFFGCCMFVSLITLEITGQYGNRLGALPAVWAGLLFSVYPLHPEAVTWIIGRVDVQCGLFYLASIWTYLRFRLLREKAYLWTSIACFMIALLSKEMAVTLPVVLTLAEIVLLSGGDRFGKFWKDGLKFAGIFWILLAGFAVFRTLILGTLVGGYGNGGLLTLLKLWRVFLDKATLLKLILPLNEEIALSFSQAKILGFAYTLIIGIFLYRLINRSVYLRPLLFLTLWMIVAVLPTFQIWHIHPNLVGSRLFFLSSAPFCMILALAALPAIDALSKLKAKIVTVIGSTALLVLFVFWSIILLANIAPWQEAGAQMSRLKSELLMIANQIPEGKRTLFLNLPQDHSGAGMLGRPQFLDTLVRLPFTPGDFSNRVLTIEPQLAGSRDYMWPGQFKNILNNPNLFSVYIWQPKLGQFIKWVDYSAQGAQQAYLFLFNDKTAPRLLCDPKNIILAKSTNWYLAELSAPQIVYFSDHIHVFPGSTGVTIYIPDVNLNPLKAGFAKLLFYGNQPDTQFNGKIQLVWNSSDSSELHQATFSDAMTLPINRHRNWSQGGQVKRLGIRFLPGAYSVDISGFEITSDTAMLPVMILDDGDSLAHQDPYKQWLLKVGSNDHYTLHYDVSKILGAVGINVLVTKPGVTFDPVSEIDLISPYPAGDTKGQKLLGSYVIDGVSGQISLPKELLVSPGLHQIRIIVRDKSGAFIGLPGEPQSLSVQ